MFKKFLLGLSLAAMLPLHAWAVVNDNPRAVVEIAVNGVIQVLKSRQNKNIITLEDRDAIRRSVEGSFDFVEMAKRSLGRPWKAMNGAQRADFVDTFRELLERSYGNRLSEYHNQTVAFGKVKTKGRRAIVNSEVIDAEKKTPVRYKLVRKKNGWRVYDIKVEGISMVSTFRSDFKQAVSKKGIDGFISELKQKIEKLKNKDQVKG